MYTSVPHTTMEDHTPPDVDSMRLTGSSMKSNAISHQQRVAESQVNVAGVASIDAGVLEHGC